MFAVHSSDGRHFLGLRQSLRGHYEIVYDGGLLGKRFIWKIDGKRGSQETLSQHLNAAINKAHVLDALCTGLRDSEIDFEVDLASPPVWAKPR